MTEPILTAEGVFVHFPGAVEPAVADAGVVVSPGAAVGIVGESGSGKTTFARVLVGALKAERGKVEIFGRPWSSVSRKDPARRAVQMIFQDPYGSLNPMLTVYQTVSEAYRFWNRVGRVQADRAAVALLEEVGLQGSLIHRRPKRLSGGQCQRVGIARALACQPSVLVADEPTSSLDVSVQAQILNLLLDLRERHHLALILISHDLSIIDYMTHDAAVMYRGRIVERGVTAELLANPMHPYTRALVDSIPGSSRHPALTRNDVDEQAGCIFAHRCPRVREDCLAGTIALEAISRREVACLHPLDGSRSSVARSSAA